MDDILLANIEPPVGGQFEPEIGDLLQSEANSADAGERPIPGGPFPAATFWALSPLPAASTVDVESGPDVTQAQTIEDPAATMSLVRLAVSAEPALSVPTRGNWVRRTAIAVVVAIIAAVSFWGWTQHSSAADWKARADELDAELASTRVDLQGTETALATSEHELTGTRQELTTTKEDLSSTKVMLSEARDQVTAVTDRLAASAAQVDSLTIERDGLVAQVGTLANDKAQVVDEREQLTAILSTAPAMTAALRACVSSNIEVEIELLNVLEAWPYRTLDKAGRLIDDSTVICEDALTKTNDFDSTLTALGV